jgi:hypothetical protein
MGAEHTHDGAELQSGRLTLLGFDHHLSDRASFEANVLGGALRQVL